MLELQLLCKLSSWFLGGFLSGPTDGFLVFRRPTLPIGFFLIFNFCIYSSVAGDGTAQD